MAAFEVAARGAIVGRVGVPHDVELDPSGTFCRNVACGASQRRAPTSPNCSSSSRRLHATQGIGLVATRDGSVQEIRRGNVVFIEPGKGHWLDAAPERLMASVAIQEADQSGQVLASARPRHGPGIQRRLSADRSRITNVTLNLRRRGPLLGRLKLGRSRPPRDPSKPISPVRCFLHATRSSNVGTPGRMRWDMEGVPSHPARTHPP